MCSQQGEHFADSLTGGTLAAQLGGALVLTEQSRIPASVDGYIRAVAFPANLGLILGGSAAVGPVPELDLAKLLNGLAG
ncbi:MAG: cell wall-binding repeat-containing protein [Candidatus Andersenbacteria bacterium]